MVAGCTEPRYVTDAGNVKTRCNQHYHEYRQWCDAEHNRREKAGEVGTAGRRKDLAMPEHLRPTAKADVTPSQPPHRRVAGRPQPPTVIINEQQRIVRQIKGNAIVSECALPDRGLHEHTLLLLKRQGWRVKYVRAVQATA